MHFSEFLNSRRGDCKTLVAALSEHFEYVSVLGADVKSRSIMAEKNSTRIGDGYDTECGFVVKMIGCGVFYEYSLDDISGDIQALARTIRDAFRIHESLAENTVCPAHFSDEPLVQSFSRENDLNAYTEQELLNFCVAQRDKLLSMDARMVNAFVSVGSLETSKLFISPNRELDQHHTWINGTIAGVFRIDGRIVETMEGSAFHLIRSVLEELPTKAEKLVSTAAKLAKAKPIVPGVYDVITDHSITGLIAHEAFGHGVELDQFVKDRALAKEYVGKYVASPICNMRDGAASALSAGSYFFDDDGVLACDTQIIKDGILVAGISDLASATQLGLAPTGNGRRENTRHKAYSRMTNTFFEPGKDKLEDMIASIDHGYMLFNTDNGMEDPKNWAIQCVAQYGVEIVDGKLTENYVAPVVMSGYVPDVLKSISMISDELVITGAGMCGKGYKEWVRVSDGGSALKVKVKLG